MENLVVVDLKKAINSYPGNSSAAVRTENPLAAPTLALAVATGRLNMVRSDSNKTSRVRNWQLG
eukprot:scaffold7992_cov69-Skeletonema_menzelii.AAC.1